jgi:hypothetical protein
LNIILELKLKLNPEFIKKQSDIKYKIPINNDIVKMNNLLKNYELSSKELNSLLEENNLFKLLYILNNTRCGIEYYNNSRNTSFINTYSKSSKIKFSNNNSFRSKSSISILGGDSLTLENIKSNDIRIFCSQYRGIHEEHNENIDHLLNNTILPYEYQNIINFIIANNESYSSTFEIFYSQLYDLYIPQYEFTNKNRLENIIFTRTNKYFEYNKQIIMGYDLPQFEYNQNNYINYFVQQQQLYLQTLSDKQKNIVKDYIHPNSYALLHEFINNGFGKGFINKYIQNKSINNLNHEIGNAFCDYIEEYILSFSPHSILSIEDIIILKSKPYFADAHVFYNDIPEEIWCIILLQYLHDLNNIILQAPPVTNTKITYRGSSTDYINIQSHTDIYAFKSNRITSFTFNYDTAKEYYDDGDSEKTLYRVAITPGSRVLFVTPLAPYQLKDELEILTPINQLFYAPGNRDRIDAWNSFKNNFCLFDEDKINSKDLVLLNI